VLKFKNVSGDTLEVRGLRPYDTTPVDANGFAEVDGTVAEELDDAWVVGEGTDARAWPKALWELDAPKKTQPKTDVKSAEKES
jgi:hypothetical protein